MEQIDHPSLMMQPRWVEIIRNNAAEAEQLGKLHPGAIGNWFMSSNGLTCYRLLFTAA
jgi:hypothetical protein